MYGRKLGPMWNFHAYHSVFSKLKNVLSEIHLLLTQDREHGKVFEKVPIIGFRRAKSLKDILVRGTVAPLEKKKGCCRSCWGTRYEICKHVVITETFRSFRTQREYCIKPDNLSCCSSNIVFFFFFSCKTCSNQYSPNGHRFVDSPSFQRRNSTWKVRPDFINFETRIHMEIMTSIWRGNFDVDSTFKIDEISMSSPGGFFYVVSTLLWEPVLT